jgi:glycogen debranching enzyme
MKNVISIENQFYILANSSLVEEETRVLKHGDIFAIFNYQGNVRPLGFENHGIYFEGTRFLSRLVMNMDADNPLHLSSAIKEQNDFYVVDLTNPDLRNDSGEIYIKRGTLHFFRSIFLQNNCCYERIRITNYAATGVEFAFGFEYEADFNDIFEVRGLHRERKGQLHAPLIGEDGITLVYEGLDGIQRTSRLEFLPKPSKVEPNQARFNVHLEPKEQKDFFFTIVCESQGRHADSLSYHDAFVSMNKQSGSSRQERCQIETSNLQFNNWINRSTADLFMMLTQTPHGIYPYAGIPWYSTIFGRDGIITALETLWMYPHIAQGVLSYLAAYQAKETDPLRDAEPGKIIHEQRSGEMANLNEIPFGRYYGSVDSTPLFLILAGHYYERTNDRALIEQIWPAIELALAWMEFYGDLDGDGFLEYERKSGRGLGNQGWKDSEDAIFHNDGQLAEAPIALCEVQAYVYEAKVQVANLAKMMGKTILSKQLLLEAKELNKKFQDKFWCEDIGTYAIALDGKKNPCRVQSSNAGQCLFSGIVPRKYARRINNALVDDCFFSGWGIRTIASSQANYNPMSYHNGSIWPHDNALIAWGMNRYGYKDSVIKVLTGLFDASLFLDLNRLAELYCGFVRRPSEGPTLYPVACNPQAWSSAAVFMLLQSCLGLKIEGAEQKIYFVNPVMPEFLDEIKITNLVVGSARVDIILHRHGPEVGMNVIRQEGKVDVVLSKSAN